MSLRVTVEYMGVFGNDDFETFGQITTVLSSLPDGLTLDENLISKDSAMAKLEVYISTSSDQDDQMVFIRVGIVEKESYRHLCNLSLASPKSNCQVQFVDGATRLLEVNVDQL